MSLSGEVRVGCSGWQYKHWRGDFYPLSVPVSQWLSCYAETFNTVEINNSFYRLPSAATFDGWRQRVPAGFIYALKASRFITHMKKLKEPRQPLRLLFSRAAHLRSNLGPVLYQLPPRWPLNVSRLDDFLKALPSGRRHVIEFRDSSWYVDEVFERLLHYGVALCLHDMEGSTTPRRPFGPFVYLRFHGPVRYGGRYPDEHLAEWAAWCRRRADEGTPVYAYFNNDIGGHAPRDAIRLRDLINALSSGNRRS